jgi:hypothetical protein
VFSAYDSVPLNKLWETLDRLTINTINTRLIEAIISLYKGFSSKMKVGNLITKGFKVTKGLRQGCSLLPTNGYTNSKYICILTQFCR